MIVAAGRRDLDAVHDGLLRWLHAYRPECDRVRLAPLRSAAAGFSSQTLFVDVVWDTADGEQEQSLVARLPPAGGGIFPTYDLRRQAGVQEALARAGIPVATPVAVELDEQWVGAPFLLMTAVPGRVLPDDPTAVLADEDLRRRVELEFVRTLADVHRVDWDGLGLSGLTPADARGLDHEVGRARDYLHWAADGDVPTVLAEALGWCAEHRPEPAPPVSLVWGDPRIGNVVYDDRFRQQALLDWEMAALGPAELDLAWYLALHDLTRDGQDDVRAPREALLVDAYAARLGRSPIELGWFTVLGLVRAESIFLRIRRMLLSAGREEPWLTKPTPGMRRIGLLTAR